MKHIVITGGTGGIGKETALALARAGHDIIVTGRSRERGEQAVAEIQRESGNKRVRLLLADMASLDQVRRLADELKENLDRLDVLINNAGVLTADKTSTADGYERHLAVNHLAPMLLTRELLPLLRASGPSRVINLAGGMPGKVNLDNLDNKREAKAMAAYSHSKAIMMAASYELASRLDPSEVTINVAYPGGANTPMTQNMSKEMLPGIMRPMAGLMKVMMRNASPVRASRSSVRLATDHELDGVTGRYLHPSAKEATWPAKIIDEPVRQAVWQMTEQAIGPFVGAGTNEPHHTQAS